MKNILLACLVAAAAFGFSHAQSGGRAELWQKEIDAFAEIDRRQTPPAGAALFVGSSSIRKWDELRGDFPASSVVNRGFGGSHLEDVIFFFDRVVAPFRARKIFLYAGENDITAGKSPARVAADFQTFVRLVRDRSPRAVIYFISLKPSPARWHLRDEMQETNRLVATACEKNKNCVFVDVWTAMLDQAGRPRADIFIEDRLHMNRKGYEIWRDRLRKHLQ